MSKLTIPGVWRNLKCLECGNETGFTRSDLDRVMSRDYVKNYHCDNCDKYTDQDWTGAAFEIIDGENVYVELQL